MSLVFFLNFSARSVRQGRSRTSGHACAPARCKKEGRASAPPSRKYRFYAILLVEVALQQALESLAVAGLVW